VTLHIPQYGEITAPNWKVMKEQIRALPIEDQAKEDFIRPFDQAVQRLAQALKENSRMTQDMLKKKR
jgi:hypothetical protein